MRLHLGIIAFIRQWYIFFMELIQIWVNSFAIFSFLGQLRAVCGSKAKIYGKAAAKFYIDMTYLRRISCQNMEFIAIFYLFFGLSHDFF